MQKKKLTAKQELFCQIITNPLSCFGNATKSYLYAYNLNIEKIKTASTNGSRLLRNAKVSARVNELLDNLISQEVVDRELVFVALQRKDLSAKVAAIREYNKLKGRVNQEPAELIIRWDDEGMERPKVK